MTDAAMAADRIAVQDVMLRYAAGVDDRDLDQYRACFADDCEIVGFSDDAIHGGDAWRDHVDQALQRFDATQHMLGPMLATIEGDQAQCRTDVQALHYLKGTEDSTLTLWATYFTGMKKIDGQWKIVRHELVRRGTKIDPPA